MFLVCWQTENKTCLVYVFKVLKPGLDRTVHQENLEPFIFAVLLTSRTILCAKNRDPCEPRSDLTVLRTMIKPLFTVLYFPLNLNFKKKKKNIIYKLTKVDLHYCSFKHAIRRWDLRSHHSFFSFFSILLSLILSLS